MADVKDCDRTFLVVDFVHYTVVTYPDAPSFPPGKLEASLRTLILSQVAY